MLHTWFKDALLGKNGVIKSYWDDAEDSKTETYEGLTVDELAQVMQQHLDAEVDVLESEEREDDDGVPVRDVKLKITRRRERVRVLPVPPEEFLIAPRWNSIFLDECPFLAHRRKMTESDLVAAGFDPEQVRELPSYSDHEFGDELSERFDDRGAFEDDTANMPAGKAMREIMVTEAYPLLDWNGDGLAERVMVTLAGSQGQILRRVDGGEDVQEVDMQPFDAPARRSRRRDHKEDHRMAKGKSYAKKGSMPKDSLELPPSDRTGGGLVRPDELAGRAHPEGAVRVHLVVVLEPAIELGHDRSGVGPGVEPDVVALEGLHEGLCDAV